MAIEIKNDKVMNKSIKNWFGEKAWCYYDTETKEEGQLRKLAEHPQIEGTLDNLLSVKEADFFENLMNKVNEGASPEELLKFVNASDISDIRKRVILSLYKGVKEKLAESFVVDSITSTIVNKSKTIHNKEEISADKIKETILPSGGIIEFPLDVREIGEKGVITSISIEKSEGFKFIDEITKKSVERINSIYNYEIETEIGLNGVDSKNLPAIHTRAEKNITLFETQLKIACNKILESKCKELIQELSGMKKEDGKLDQKIESTLSTIQKLANDIKNQADLLSQSLETGTDALTKRQVNLLDTYEATIKSVDETLSEIIDISKSISDKSDDLSNLETAQDALKKSNEALYLKIMNALGTTAGKGQKIVDLFSGKDISSVKITDENRSKVEEIREGLDNIVNKKRQKLGDPQFSEEDINYIKNIVKSIDEALKKSPAPESSADQPGL